MEILVSPILRSIWSIHIFVDMCRDTVHILVEGYDHWSDETTGKCMPTSSSAAARLQGQQAQKLLYLFHLVFSGQTVLQ